MKDEKSLKNQINIDSTTPKSNERKVLDSVIDNYIPLEHGFWKHIDNCLECILLFLRIQECQGLDKKKMTVSNISEFWNHLEVCETCNQLFKDISWHEDEERRGSDD